MTSSARPAPSTRLWHGFAPMGKVDGNEFVVARGKGARVWDVDGREYLDGTAGLWFVNVGHGRSEIAQAAGRADGAPRRPPLLRATTRTSPRWRWPSASARSRRSTTASSSSPTTAPSRSTAPARSRAATGACCGQPERQVIVSRRHAYHGMNAYGTSLAGIPANMEGFGRADRGHGDGGVGRPGRPRAHARRARGPRRRVHRRAGDRRRRRHPAARRLLAGGRADLPRARRPASSPTRSSAASAGSASGSAPSATACSPTSSPAPRASRPATCRSARSSPSAACGSPSGPRTRRRSATATPTPATPSPAPRAWPCSTSTSARALFERVRQLEPFLRAPDGDRSPTCRAWPRCAPRASAPPSSSRPRRSPRPAAWSTWPPSPSRNHGVITRGLRGVALQLSPPFVSTEDELAGDGRGPARRRCSRSRASAPRPAAALRPAVALPCASRAPVAQRIERCPAEAEVARSIRAGRIAVVRPRRCAPPPRRRQRAGTRKPYA